MDIKTVSREAEKKTDLNTVTRDRPCSLQLHPSSSGFHTWKTTEAEQGQGEESSSKTEKAPSVLKHRQSPMLRQPHENLQLMS